MIEQAPPSVAAGKKASPDQQDFLTTHRAQSVALREFTRVTEALGAQAKQIAAEFGYEAPVQRMSPDRCILQVGPVALTVAHLRKGTSSLVGGQLLAIVWEGIIAPRGDHVPERLGARKAEPTPRGVWEESYTVSALDEASWHWHPRGPQHEGFTSLELVDRCMGALVAALPDRAASATLDTPEVT